LHQSSGGKTRIVTIHFQQHDWRQSTSSVIMYWIGFYPIQSGNQHGKLHETASIGFLPSALWLLRKPRVDCWRGDRKPLVRDDEAAPGAAPGAPAPAAQRPQSVAAPRRSTGADAPRSGVPATLSVAWACSVLFGRFAFMKLTDSLTEFVAIRRCLQESVDSQFAKSFSKGFTQQP
jgi:hypothetical protein